MPLSPTSNTYGQFLSKTYKSVFLASGIATSTACVAGLAMRTASMYMKQPFLLPSMTPFLTASAVVSLLTNKCLKHPSLFPNITSDSFLKNDLQQCADFCYYAHHIFFGLSIAPMVANNVVLLNPVVLGLGFGALLMFTLLATERNSTTFHYCGVASAIAIAITLGPVGCSIAANLASEEIIKGAICRFSATLVCLSSLASFLWLFNAPASADAPYAQAFFVPPEKTVPMRNIYNVPQQAQAFLDEIKASLDRKEALGVKSALFYGPPGTGKSLLALGMANDLNCGIFNLLDFNKLDNSDGAFDFPVATLNFMRAFIEARQYSIKHKKTAFIVLDEIDSVASDELLILCFKILKSAYSANGISRSDIVLIATSNHLEKLPIDLVDFFDTKIAINAPNAHDLKEIALNTIKNHSLLTQHPVLFDCFLKRAWAKDFMNRALSGRDVHHVIDDSICKMIGYLERNPNQEDILKELETSILNGLNKIIPEKDEDIDHTRENSITIGSDSKKYLIELYHKLIKLNVALMLPHNKIKFDLLMDGWIKTIWYEYQRIYYSGDHLRMMEIFENNVPIDAYMNKQLNDYLEPIGAWIKQILSFKISSIFNLCLEYLDKVKKSLQQSVHIIFH